MQRRTKLIAVVSLSLLQTLGCRGSNSEHLCVIAAGAEKKERADAQTKEPTMTFTAEKRYLNLPVKNRAPMRRMRVLDGGIVLREFDIELADAIPDFWVFLDLAPLTGKSLTLWVDQLPKNSDALGQIVQSDEIPGAENLYRERYRPQFHFSPRRGWNNDPNGLVFYKGEYHLCFQHNPYGWNWGNMHWGHAVSTDLMHWTELPIAIYPKAYGDWAFSGSAVVDHDNTAGFQRGEEKTIVAAYTSTGRGEVIAYSLDRGRTFTEYEGNPVVKHQGRDPKVIWYAPGGHWVMAVYNEQGDSKGISFYTSPNLKDWMFQSRIDGYYECPELFELPVDGNPENTRWVVYAADGDYALGAFDGKVFSAESPKMRFNYGNCFYASQTFSNIPEADGRRIQIAWGTIGHRDMPFNQRMNFPVSLTLHTTDEGIRLFAQPVREIERLHTTKHLLEQRVLSESENPLRDISGELFDIRAECLVADADALTFTIRGVEVTYSAKDRELACLDKRAPLAPDAGKIRLQFLVDRTSIEIFANDGCVYMPMGIVLDDMNRSLAIHARGGAAQIASLEINELRSAWVAHE